MYAKKTHQQRRQFYAKPKPQPGAQQPTVAQPAPQPTESEPHNFLEVSQFCQEMGLPAEAVGSWVWVTFDQKPDTETLKALRDFGFHWSPRREKWAHNCGYPSKSAQAVNPWDKYEHYPLTESAEELDIYASNGRYVQ